MVKLVLEQKRGGSVPLSYTGTYRYQDLNLGRPCSVEIPGFEPEERHSDFLI